jgi:hypothetical protein
MMEHSDETRKEARRIADATWALVAEHEEDAHDGEPCWEERIGMLAYVAHSIGVLATPETVLMFGALLADYERTCPNLGQPHDPDDHPDVGSNGGMADLQ